MRLLSFAALCGPIVAAACSQDRPSGPFDGASLAGWEGDTRFWSVEDGALVGRTTSRLPLERTTYLVWTGGELRDFELTVRYRLAGGNSGVQFRSRVVGQDNVAGYQADLADAAGYTGQIYEQFGRGFLARRGESTRVATSGKAETTRFASEEEMAAVVRSGDWNELLIRAVGASSEVWINGTRTAELHDESPLRASLSGVLALQLHAGEPMEVRFRDFQLRDLGGVHDVRDHVDPQWIWTHDGAEPDEEAWFATSVELGDAVQRATLYAVGDDGYEAYVNGELAAAGQGSDRMQQVDVTRLVRPGANHLALWGKNEEGLAAVLVSLVVDTPAGKRFFGTDAGWRGATSEPADWTRSMEAPSWGAVHSYGPLGTEPWSRPTTPVKHAGLSALPGEAIELPDGYAAELLYSVPRARQGSWVSLAFDPAGNAYASDQHGFLYRIVPAAAGADPSTTRIERLDVPLGEAQGLCWAFDALYVVVNASGRFASGLYRVRDSDGDGRLDHVDALREFDGNTEHGPHAVVLGPDGVSLYVVGGNEVDVPADALTEWGPSYLPVGRLPASVQRVDLTQFELSRESASGWIARTDRDGARWELVAAGLRNPYDVAFDREGELFTFDSDMEWDLGLPWYVPTRLLHVVERADFGFRQGSARWPTWFPDTLPAVVEVGRTSPTGMLAGSELAFSARHRRALFAGDWLKGRILAFHLEPDGATYRADVEVFASGKPLPVTDLAVGPDGALYFTTGGRHVQSGLYRIVYRGERDPEPAPTPTELEARALRERLASSPLMVVERRPRDRHERHAFRSALERDRPPQWDGFFPRSSALLRADVDLARARVGTPDEVRELLVRLAEAPLDVADEGLSATVLRTLEVALLRAGDLAPELRARLADRLLALFPCGQRDLDREIGVLLASLPEAEERFVPLALERLAAAPDGAEAFHWALLVRQIRSGWTIGGRRQFFAWLQSADSAFDGGRAVPIFLRELRRDALATLTEEERAALGSLVEPGTAADMATAARAFVQAWRMEDLEPDLAAAIEGERDLARGPRLLREAQCLACHRVDGRGLAVGPELDGLAGRFAPLDLLESILEPSREVPERYRDTLVTTADERLHIGRLVGEEEGSLLLLDSYGARTVLRIPRDEIVEQSESPVSPMPEGLLDTFTREEVYDLVAYLLQDAD